MSTIHGAIYKTLLNIKVSNARHMRCIWSTRVKSLPQRCVHNRQISRATVHSRVRDGINPPTPYPNQINGKISTISRSPSQTATLSPTKRSKLTQAQISRASAQAVRISIHSGNTADAYYIVNSLSHSMHPEAPTLDETLDKIPLVRSVPRRPFIPLEFDTSVSPRLSAHALIHGLLRVGLPTKAFKLTEELMEDGIKVCPRSITAVTNALLAASQDRSGLFTTTRANELAISAQGLKLHPRLVADQSAQYAIRLILKTKKHRQRCSADAYYSILRYCLSRGKIIVASLLICDLVKEYQLRRIMAARLKGEISEVDDGSKWAVEDKARLRSQLKDILWENENKFDKNVVLSLVTTLGKSMAHDPQNAMEETSLGFSLQALANIATLLDERRIPFPEVAPLIRTLYSYPKSRRKVWIIKNGQPKRVEAYAYFHDVLLRLVTDPPLQKVKRKLRKEDSDPKGILPPLDLDSCNALLHYALRHRLDPILASRLLLHMRSRPLPVKPDITTYNTLLRSGTLLRRIDLPEKALSLIRQTVENGVMITPEEHSYKQLKTTDLAPNIPRVWGHSPISIALRRLKIASFDTHSESSSSANPLTADSYTLTSYIMYLTATGQPHVVADILFKILPELAIVDHPSWGTTDTRELFEFRKFLSRNRKEQIERAVALGPHFFVALLNALCKAGKTGFTERVWILAKEAERASWVLRPRPGMWYQTDPGPWFLHVHAYTIMLQCYAAEARKGMIIRRRGGQRGIDESERGWVPRSNNAVRGWARFVLSEQRHVHGTSRASSARMLGQRLYASMRDAAGMIFQDLLQVEESSGPAASPPHPDARFFNAALALFTRDARSTRRTRVGPSRWRYRLAAVRRQYLKAGKLPKHGNSILHSIAREMVQHGFSIPIGVRLLLTGRLAIPPHGKALPAGLTRQPFTYPLSLPSFRPYALPVVKTRGLPLRRTRKTGHKRASVDLSKNAY